MTKSTESGVDTLWQWDAVGNLTRRATTGGDTWEYLWDARDKMTKVRKQPYGGAMADVASYTYDAMGRRFQKTSGGATTTYYQDGLTPVVEASASLTKRHRAFEGDLGNVVQTVDGANNTFYAYDARLGNVVATFGTDGKLKQNYNAYGMDAFGNVYAGNPENFGITTKQLDADTGLYYFNARWYNSLLACFVSAASLSIWEEPPYTTNFQNPIFFLDYNGRNPAIVGGGVLGGIGGWLSGLINGARNMPPSMNNKPEQTCYLLCMQAGGALAGAAAGAGAGGLVGVGGGTVIGGAGGVTIGEVIEAGAGVIAGAVVDAAADLSEKCQCACEGAGDPGPTWPDPLPGYPDTGGGI